MEKTDKDCRSNLDAALSVDDLYRLLKFPPVHSSGDVHPYGPS